ncbi:hypothetical protein [Tychonema sp. BBK16]|uniref:hypothetical protein n=1 Tax=Tychonema sp. BBK16 TaxID=2699888 RepID=UPI001F18CBC4|nr:hypothetical protein [Tychonema sp. BBK16]MCF6374687.1 hypothetical protein [Tychonema sp. BBK16]
MTNEIPQIQIVFSDEFKTRLRTLLKRYGSSTAITTKAFKCDRASFSSFMV